MQVITITTMNCISIIVCKIINMAWTEIDKITINYYATLLKGTDDPKMKMS